MSTLEQLKARREAILSELAGLEEIRRGTVTEQCVEATRKDGTRTRRGPYLLYTFKEKGKTVSRRIKDSLQAAKYKSQIEAFHRFQSLTQELVSLGEQISDRTLGQPGDKKS